MKKLVLTLVVIAFATGAFAQLSGGLKAGANFSNMKYKLDDEKETGDMKVGFQVGGYLVATLSDNIALQPELYFSSMGSKEDDASLNLGYISVPVLLRYNINEQFHVHLGPQVGFLLSAKAKLDGESEDIKDAFGGIDFGGAVGFGADFGAINANLRYYQGFSDIGDEETFGDVKITNSAIQLSVGYRLFGGE